jgi:hypothetical protein
MVEGVVRVIFTLDYEIHGNGEGCPYELMVEPTARLLRLFDAYGAKLTIMADIAEILKFKQYADQHGKDLYHYQNIAAQLQGAIRGGHDVQLHIHSSYFNATHDGRRWVQDWAEYNFAALSLRRLDELIKLGKNFLESLVQPVNPAYRCNVFRAANWSVSPSKNVVRALVKNGIRIDTSVFKYGRREGLVNFDYRLAHSDMVPWRADEDAIWRSNPHGQIWEVPIYSEQRRIPAFFSLNRIYRFILGRCHRVPDTLENSGGCGVSADARDSSVTRRLGRLVSRHAWKADFNQCTGGQLIAALRRGADRHRDSHQPLPFVLIGHSKLFSPRNERTLRPFLVYVARNSSQYGFGTFDSLGLATSFSGI